MTDNQITFEETGYGYYYVDYCGKYTGCIIEADTSIIKLWQDTGSSCDTFTIDQLECILNKMKELQREKR